MIVRMSVLAAGLHAALLLLLAGCERSQPADDGSAVSAAPAPVVAAADEHQGYLQGWFYQGLAEHPRQVWPVKEALAWRVADAQGQPLYLVWLSSEAMAPAPRPLDPPVPGDPSLEGSGGPAAFGHPGVLLRFDQQGRNDGLLTDFCPRREGQVQCLSMSGIGVPVITRIDRTVVQGALYTTDTQSQARYVAPFKVALQRDELKTPLPTELHWLPAGGGEPGAAFRKRNQAALDANVDTLVDYSMPDSAEFLRQPGTVVLLARMAARQPQVLGGSQQADVATLFVRDAELAVRRVDLRLLDGRWRVETARPSDAVAH